MTNQFEFQKLHLSQYLSLHPLKDKKEKYKSGYVSVLNYFLKQFGTNQWSESNFSLFKVYLSASTGILEKKPPKLKYCRYRDVILVDLLFLTSFSNEDDGKKIFDLVCNYYGKGARKKLNSVFEYFYSKEERGDFQKYKSKEVLDIVRCNRLFLELPEKKIMITANMSAGKSTLLNALTGKRVNKTMNDACTAKVHSIFNKPKEDGYIYEYDYELDLNASREVLMDDNDENTSSNISVGTFFRNDTQINRKVVLVDTPGVNSALDKEHKDIADNTVKNQSCDLLIYLMNGEVIATDDERKHLIYVKENYSGKIIFIINKLDRYRAEDSVPGTIDTVKNYLEQMGFEKPVVYPISAYAAYLGRMKKNGENLNEDEIEDLEFVKRKLSKKDFQYNQYYDNPVQGEFNDEIDKLICNSGITSLEKIIYE